ncbi:MAG: 7-carboxy-7-deazaguanine synthase QueE [Pseudomonadota bacterium]
MASTRDALPIASRLRISETFLSLQGEALSAGLPTFFIRLTGCPLRCQYCDTAYAFHGGEWRSIDQLVAAATESAAPAVCVTGGEPLAQPNCTDLLTALCDAGFDVSIETSGAFPIEAIDSRVVRVVDIKTPGSAEANRTRWSNLAALRATDVVKFVICSREDFDWACGIVDQYELVHKVTVFFSPSYEELSNRELADWLVANPRRIRLQLQLHKLLWGDGPGR